MTWRIVLPWPTRDMNPNGRVHWRTRSKVTATARKMAWARALEAGVTRQPADSRPKLVITFAPPDRRRRDLANFIATTKAPVDGIADALGVDDSRFAIAYAFADCTVKGGQVVVEVSV